jgi:hypothetical protein
MTTTRMPPSLWVGQQIHFACLASLLILTWAIWSYLGKPFSAFFWCAIACPIVHQIYVWLAWRLELQSSAISKTIGFRGYVVFFFLLFASRFISLFVLAWIDRGSLKFHILPQIVVTVIFTVFGLYAMYSVKKYFGFIRAVGADHFDSRYRDIPFVKGGIFRFTSNGMYVYAFLLFWAIATGFNSSAALIVASFSHAYIWVHYFSTEKPDMNFIYTSTPEQNVQLKPE